MAEINPQQGSANTQKIPKTPHAEREERILAFWAANDTFQKSLDKKAPRGDFTFYDGPPFATGLPHYGHILPGTMKDVIPRYKTMRGYTVRRRWGWDCHGLPVENLLEKELGLQSKKDILSYGIGKFNAAARDIVFRYADEWRQIVPRLGRWVDMKNDYRTMDSSYTESVWWAFKNLNEKGLVYEDFKSMNLCPHCETTLANFEVAQGYKDITDISVYVKFALKENPGTFLVAWTTTPWTLPGNVALAVGPKIDYLSLEVETSEIPDLKNGETYIIADTQDTILRVFGNSLGYGPHPHEGDLTWANVNYRSKGNLLFKNIKKISSNELIGKSYVPVFNYYSNRVSKSGEVLVEQIKNDQVYLSSIENGWKIYPADFVTTTDGTGIVHIAPAFGSDDYELMKKYKLPFVQHVAFDGTFKPEVKEFAGKKVKPRDTDADKNFHQSSDIEVIKWLAHNNFLFEKEKLIHSYPHCWRCETPLLNYATSSWFVRVTEFKDKLVKENKKVRWVPTSVGENRFGNWLEGARDWAISRSRFWGAPIPVWKEEVGTGSPKYHVMGSVADLKKYSRAKNTFYVMRHGEAENNVLGILSGDADAPHHLTEKGRVQVTKAAEGLKGTKFDLIYVSPFLRTRETLDILKEKLGWKDDQIIVDPRISELRSGHWNGRTVVEYLKYFTNKDRFAAHPDGVENFAEMKTRMGDFLYDTEKCNTGKTILVITHESPAHMLISAARCLNRKATVDLREHETREFLLNAEVRKIDFSPLPHNAEYELDLHRPFIDNIELTTVDGKRLTRVPDVFDCWFESGSMPYAEAHYPFENGKGVEEGSVFDPKGGLFSQSRGYPADFIAEGLDQTRGWFYSMLVLGTALFKKSPYKNVIVNGLILAEDGQKMSKSKKNYPDPMLIVDKYGADALRHYLMSSQAVRAEDLRFSEKGVDEVVKKVINRLLNVVSFYEMYADGSVASSASSHNILDKWIISRLNELVANVTDGLEVYELDRAARPIEDFIDDLSTWYLRRSRDRFKGQDAKDKNVALATTRFVLIECTKVIAPFMPFVAEDIYQRVADKALVESVHLSAWPVGGKIDKKLIADMKVARDVFSKGLEARMAAKINVRQPLATLASGTALDSSLIEIGKDEMNVKEIRFDPSVERGKVRLTIDLTPELKEEGDLRELLRKIQDMRKEKGFSVKDKVVLVATEDLRSIISKNDKAIKEATNLSAIEFGETFGLK